MLVPHPAAPTVWPCIWPTAKVDPDVVVVVVRGWPAFGPWPAAEATDTDDSASAPAPSMTARLRAWTDHTSTSE